ncbi:MAG TPA: 2-oxoacid:acceptor oxidoreductase family protein [Syntrophales bacterium]|jgi:2-oxoglutarate ferredoxin oxidoreductase subunit gamma|nr:2-oxoacid:acceptor oxidoreductase family protein [Syntrophales bacterium]HON23918.1 2-oxoacid:acceptor oxidoreductase family protein [Syntrophales bacterium]HOU78523.1 2-oxoacid:acceptor oxidoreductase family protein [Syntrophales bacterium]HPC31606.1 2-oxoacid:acceptor oxidoreductase family protein [Syntrophales bacterium]HQG35452.1 2-oxoacid:acceptor oxidoreductase family protein [Syntrophales bacterium]
MIKKTIFAGFGGQGVLMMGYICAHAAMSEGYHVTYLPSYGVEVRGGTANCTVAVSDEEIASPIASEPDYLVVMNKPSLATFQNRVAPGGDIFLNSSIIDNQPTRKDVHIHRIPAGELAEQLGSPRVLNIVMMGAFIRKTSIITPEAFLKGLRQILGEKKKAAMEINRKAFAAGYELKS